MIKSIKHITEIFEFSDRDTTDEDFYHTYMGIYAIRAMSNNKNETIFATLIETDVVYQMDKNEFNCEFNNLINTVCGELNNVIAGACMKHITILSDYDY